MQTAQMFVQLLISGLLMGSVYALIASGLAFIYGPVDLVNFAHGDLVMIAMYIAFFSASSLRLALPASLLIAATIMVILCVLNYRFLIRPVLKAPRLAQALVTYGLGIGLQSVALYFFGPEFKSLSNPTFAGHLSILGLNISLARLFAGLFGVATFGLLYLLQTRTKIGKAIQAVAMNKQAAVLVGIDLERAYALSFAISGMCIAVAGVFLVQFFYVYTGVGTSLLNGAFVAMVIGGFGSMPGAFVGGLIVGVVQSLGGYYLSTALKDVLIYAFFVILMAYRPRGLFGW